MTICKHQTEVVLQGTSRLLLRYSCQIYTPAREYPANTSPHTTKATGQGLIWQKKESGKCPSTQSGVAKDLTWNILVILIEYAILRNNYVWVPIFISLPCSIAKSEPQLFPKMYLLLSASIFIPLKGPAFNLSFNHSFMHSYMHAFPLIYGAPTVHQTLLFAMVTSKNITVSIALFTNNWDWHFRTLRAALNSCRTLAFLFERI